MKHINHQQWNMYGPLKHHTWPSKIGCRIKGFINVSLRACLELLFGDSKVLLKLLKKLIINIKKIKCVLSQFEKYLKMILGNFLYKNTFIKFDKSF